jgi:hypothetical protein
LHLAGQCESLMEDSSKCRQPSIMGERPNRADQPFPLPLPSRSSFILLCRSRCRCCCCSSLLSPAAAVVRDTPHHHSPPSCLSEVCFRSTLPTAMSKALFVATEVEFSRAPIIRILPNAIRSKVRLLPSPLCVTLLAQCLSLACITSLHLVQLS